MMAESKQALGDLEERVLEVVADYQRASTTNSWRLA
jgi:hypothetical protein